MFVEQWQQIYARTERRPAWRLEGRGDLQNHGWKRAAHFYNHHPDQPSNAYTHARSAIPCQHCISECWLQPAATPRLFPGNGEEGLAPAAKYPFHIFSCFIKYAEILRVRFN